MQQPPELPPMPGAPMPSAPAQPIKSGGSDSLPPAPHMSPGRPAPVGTRRLRQMVTAVAGGGFAFVALVGVGELALRDGLRPTDFLATIEARTERGIFNQKMGAAPGQLVLTEADYQKALAEAQREGQAKAELVFQRELAVVQADKERVVGAYQTLYQRANIIAQAALQMEAVAQQFRQQLITMSNGGRTTVIMLKDLACGAGMQEACVSAQNDRRSMISEADALSRGDVGDKVRELMSGIDDPATFITREDRRRHGEPTLDR